MAAAVLIVTCPECEKKFKPKSDVSGKKIKCPFCTKPFVVPVAKGAKGAKDDKGKSDAAKSGKPKGDAKGLTEAPANPDQKPRTQDDLDNDPDPYGVKTVELVPRCPNCTEEMDEHDTICLACGYNTMTRQWGKTEKTFGLTIDRRLLHLLPAIGSAIFVFFAVNALLFYCVVVPYWVAGGWMEFTDSEALKLFVTVACLFLFWAAGVFCFKKFIEKPKPDELQMEESVK